jgi:hypothetical protein
MILIDNYIHQNIDKNLLPIVEAMLPIMLRNTAFHLTILTERKDTVNYKDDVYEKLTQRIKAIRPQLDFIIELYVQNGKGDFHDRTILTNNVKINSGAGFSLRRQNGISQNSTKIKIWHPCLQNCSDTCDEEYQNILCEAKKMIGQIEKGCGGERFPEGGTCQNRLINP